MKKIRLLVPMVALLLLAGLPARAAEPPLEGVPRFGNVFVIIGENEELVQINDNSMPYLVDTLIPQSRVPQQVLRRHALLHRGVCRHDVGAVHAV